DEFTQMVQAVRQAEKALGNPFFSVNEKLRQKGKHFSRSLFVVKEVPEGEVFSRENVRSIRPGNGLHPKFLDQVLGKKAKRAIPKGTPLDWDLVE
ncbi:MAG TPA: SAF domain-containing protein, partial [Thermotogota bacterium]|nr:SAF domain-containing protein [Thermotogota bacterium]